MAQSGLHGLIGLALTRREFGRVIDFGLLVGSVIPDADLFVAVPYSLITKTAQVDPLPGHRSWSHSLILQAAVCLLAYVLWARRHPDRRSFLLGAWLGMAIHSVTDIFLWFSPVDLTWPLGLFGVIGPVNIWANVWQPLEKAPMLVGNIMAAAEFMFLGLFFGYMAEVAQGAGEQMLRTVRRLSSAFLVYATVLGILAAAEFRYFFYAVWPVLMLLGFPLLAWVVWRLRDKLYRTPDQFGRRRIAHAR